MKKMKLFLVVVLLVLVSSIVYAGSITQSTDNFKPGNKYYNANARYICVEYARWLQSGLPRGLYTLAQKKAIINSSKPKKKSVAILDGYGDTGHVAYVADVDDSGKNKSITLYEANYPSGVERKRVIKGKNVSMKDLEKYAHIVGYWKP